MDNYPIAGESCSPLESQDADMRAAQPEPPAINDIADAEAENTEKHFEPPPHAAIEPNDAPEPKPASPFRDDGGSSLPAMAARELDATLQLLVERTQYITGATGAAVALKDTDGMLCRASAGASSPELGAHLQVNSGLSGESVRTGQILRCDDAETDARVNRESCRELGIASVVVMPLLREGDVEGVFELFSDKPYAFGARDIATLERMGEMVQTAIDHARAAHTPHKQAEADKTVASIPEIVEGETNEPAQAYDETLELETASVTASDTDDDAVAPRKASPSTEQAVVFWGPRRRSAQDPNAAQAINPAPEKATGQEISDLKSAASANEDIHPGVPIETANVSAISEAQLSIEPAIPPEVEIAKQREVAAEVWKDTNDQVPPNAADEELGDMSSIMPVGFANETANIGKCEGCGFPVSEGRRFCLDCDSTRKGNRPATAVTTGVTGEPAVPQFLSGIESTGDESWLAAHKYLIAVLVAVAFILIALLLSHSF